MDNLGAKARGYSLGYIFRKIDKTKVGYMSQNGNLNED